MFKEIIVTKVEMVGFKGFRERTVFALDKLTTFQADNGKGKTSIGEAITWAFLGSNLWGNDKVDSILLNNHSKKMQVTVTFLADGEEHSLTRMRQGTTTSIILDKFTIKQSDLSAQIGSKDIFLSIYNPEYFISMSDKEGRDFLISILENISMDDIKAQMDTTSLNYLQDDLLMVHSDPNNYMKLKRAEIKELEKDIIFDEGVISKLNIKDNADDVPKEYDTSRIKELEEIFEGLTINNNLDTEFISKMESLKEEKKKREIELSVLSNESVENAKELQAIRENLSSLNMEKYDISEERKKEMILLENKLTDLRNQYRKEKEMPLQIGDKCPTCKTVISNSHLTLLQEEVGFNLQQLKEEGNFTATKLAELKESNEKILKGMTEIREKKRFELEAKYENLKADMEKAKENKSESLKKDIMKLNHDIIELEKSQEEKLQARNEGIKAQREEIKGELLILNKEKAEIDAHNIGIKLKQEQLMKDKEEHKRISKEIELLTEEISVKKCQIDAAKQYTSVKANLLSELIHSHLNDVSIELQKVVKSTGELKDCFEIRYKDRGMKVLSTSEKIRTGLEISNLVINQLGLRYPVFVDNKESITHYNAPEVQIIEAMVVEGLELNVILDKIAV